MRSLSAQITLRRFGFLNESPRLPTAVSCSPEKVAPLTNGEGDFQSIMTLLNAPSLRRIFSTLPCAISCGIALLSGFSGALHAAPDAKTTDAGDMQWKRTPFQVVPFISSAPRIDGVVDPKEWQNAADFGPLKIHPDGRPDGLERKMWMAYDEKNIYIAFTLERPRNAIPPAVPNSVDREEGGSGGVVSDAVEVLFSPKLDFKNSFSFWIYGNGAYGDALCSPGKNRAWNADWQRAARANARGWEGEMAIPFKAFGLDGPPSPQEWWGFDFVDNRNTPSRLLGFWSFRGGSWHQFYNFGRIRFAPDPAVRFVLAGDKGDKNAVDFEVVASQPGTVKVSLELLKRKEGDDGGPKSYFDNIESGVSHDAQAEFTKGSTLADMIKFAETFYEPLPNVPPVEKTLDLSPGKPVSFGIEEKLPFGEYLVRYRVENKDGQIVAAGTDVFNNDPILFTRIEPYWLYSEVLDVFTDLRKAPLEGDGELVYEILPASGKGRPLAKTSLKIPASKGVINTPVDIKGIKPGSYQFDISLRDSSGREISRYSMPIHRPEFPAWYKNDIGKQIKVPAPWTPLQATKDGKVTVWGRTYDLSKVFPSSVISQGKEVLSGPVTLTTQTSAGPVSWTVDKLAIKSRDEAAVVYDVVMSGGGIKLSGTARVEFDGLIWYDLVATPAGAPVEIVSMKLDVPVQPAFSELMSHHNYLEDPVLGGGTLPKAEINGQLGLLQESRMPFTPFLWIGNEAAGMGFIAEAPIDWSIKSPNSVLETMPAQGDSPSHLIANFVQTPRTLEKPMRLQFGLQGTPIRETPKDRSVLNIFQKNGVFGDDKTFADLAKKGCKVVVFYYAWRGNALTEMGGTPERPPTEEQRKKLKEAVQAAHRQGLKVIMFTGWGINAVSPNWKNYSYELARYPITNGGWGTFSTSAGLNGGYADFMAWGHADLAKEYEVDGVLWDSAANISADANLRTGNAWVDDQGRVRPKFAVLATRELYRRIYNIYKGEVRQDGVIYNHGGSSWPIGVYADMLNRGEGRPMTAKTLRESWIPFEEFRSDYSGEPFGVLYSGEVNDWAKYPMRASTHFAVTTLHGTYSKEYAIGGNYRSYDYEARPVAALWETFNWLPMDGGEQRHYYYQNAAGKYQAVKASPASLLSSAFVSGDKKRAIVVVSNLDTTPVTDAVVELDPASWGIPANAKVRIQDGVTGKDITVDGGKVKIDIDQQRYRVLKLSFES